MGAIRMNNENYKLLQGYEPGKGLDQIWHKLNEFLLLEVKGPGASPSAAQSNFRKWSLSRFIQQKKSSSKIKKKVYTKILTDSKMQLNSSENGFVSVKNKKGPKKTLIARMYNAKYNLNNGVFSGRLMPKGKKFYSKLF